MTKVISCILVLSLVLAVTVSAMPNTQNSSVKLNDEILAQIQGGMPWQCWAAIGGMAIATAGAAAATGGIGVFVLGQLGLVSATIGLVASC